MTSAKMLDKASAAFKKQERQREGTKAMAEYQAGLVAEQSKIEKLRALRLAHEAAHATNAEVEAAAPKQKSNARRRTTRAKRPS